MSKIQICDICGASKKMEWEEEDFVSSLSFNSRIFYIKDLNVDACSTCHAVITSEIKTIKEKYDKLHAEEIKLMFKKYKTNPISSVEDSIEKKD